MAGGEGSARRRTAKSVQAAAAAGPQAPLRGCSTKRKAGKEAAAAAAAASGWMPRPCASSGSKKETTAAAAAGVSACANADRAAGAKNRLPAKDIRWILAQAPRVAPARFAALKRRNPELVPRPGEEEDKNLMALYGVTKAFYEMQEKLPKLQAWVRSELREKGCVEVDDGWFRHTAETQAAIDREWPRVRAKLHEIRMMDEPCLREGGDESESESDSGEEEDEEAALASVMKDYLICN